ncbi:sugar phosphate isomerase/epimerase [Ruminococcaceae bacterium OttesenSCG-928-L11]|nr:sugar phosphate isomerase/epimerase [Ruminococcaceae bacterium OttesenSCG-928-L11]
MLKKSINAWSVDNDTGFEEMFQQLKEAGFEGVELNVDKAGNSAHSLSMETTEEELAEIRALSERYGLPVVSISSALHSGNMGSPDPECRKFSQQLVLKQLQCAKALGGNGVLVVPGGISPEISIRQAYENCRATLGEIREQIAEFQIYVGVENVWNGFFMSPFDMANFIDTVDNAWVGAYYDVGNVIAFSWSEYWIEVLGQRIHNVHVKDFKRNGSINRGGDFVDLLKGDVNWPSVIPALRKAGFDGYLTAEVFIGDCDVEGITYPQYYKLVSEQLDQLIRL